MKKTNAGFTLVELSIVLVVIGLIIGGVLTGKQIMLNAQITNTVNAAQAFQAQFQTYVQNYGAMPGDDGDALARFSSADIPAKTDSPDGTLSGTFDSTTENVETRLLWADLRAAGLIKGAGSDESQPANPFGGVYGFQHGAFTGTGAFTTNVLCLNQIPGDAALSIDSRLDDGQSDTGSLKAMVATGTVGEASTGTIASAYDAANTYTLCIRM